MGKSRIQLLQHLQGLQFREIGHMKAIVGVENMEDALPLLPREAEEVHRGIIHTEENGKCLCLFVTEEMSMRRLAIAIGASQKVEVELRVES